jgi:Ca2+-binding RTX toxin-like protein
MSSTFAQVNSQSSLEKQPPRSLVFIDSAVEDYESIAARVLPGQQVVIVDSTKNGIEQITSELENYASINGAIDSVHIISHGNSGSLQLGDTALDSDNIEQYKSQLEKWQTSLAPGADILLYGCDVAADTGANFVDRLSQFTGADVAASTNRTGSDGDWNLEYVKGQIESPIALEPEAMASYQGNLLGITFRVTNTNDSGSGSLRDAIAKASAGDYILFAPTLAGQTIGLTRGQLEIPPGKNLIIDGAAAPGLKISGNNLSRVFSVNANVDIRTSFTLKNLHIINAKTNEYGGAIKTTDEVSVRVDKVEFTNNVADKGGGAMYLGWNSSLNVTNSKFTGNKATAANDERGAGAIAFVSPKNLTVGNCDFLYNQGINGAAINSLNGKVTIDNSRFIGNDTTAGFFATGQGNPFLRGYGGALYIDRASSTNESSGTATIRGSVFKDNKGRAEGGAAYVYTAPGDSVTVAYSLFENNETKPLPGGNGGNGGGLVVMSNGPNKGFTLTNSAFKGNKATGQGGALWVMGAPTKISDSNFTGNQVTTTAPDGYAHVGGAITVYSPTTIVNSRMANNYAGWVGGGLAAADGYPVSVQNTTFLNNTSGNPYGIQQHTNRELIDATGNLQWPAKKTNNFNDYNATAYITIASWLAGPLGAPLVDESPAIDTGSGASNPEDGNNNGSATGDSDPMEPPTDTETPAPQPEPPTEPETPAPQPEPPTEPETPAPQPEPPAPEPETPAPQPEPPTEPETPAPQPEPPTEPETPAPQPEPPTEPETPAPQPEPPAPEPEAPAPEPEAPAPEPEAPAPEPVPPTQPPTETEASPETEAPPETATWDSSLLKDLNPPEIDSAAITPNPVEQTLNGGGEGEVIMGGDINESINGGPGNNVLFGMGGDDNINGGADQDMLLGNKGSDLIQGYAGNDIVSGGKDNDTVLGGEGDDFLAGDMGNDNIAGGDGNDSIYGGKDDDILLGENGDDYILGNLGNDTINAGDGNDIAFGNEGADLIFGFLGDDTLDGGQENDSLDGGEGNDLLLGGDGNDVLLGGDGNDKLDGGNGNDILNGGAGDDFLNGGAGDDTLIGGLGNDVFLLNPSFGSDIITDFRQGEDLIGLTSGLSFAQLSISSSNNETLITLTETNELLAKLNGVTPGILTASDFTQVTI